jgi:hypothetical protein
MNSTFIKKRTGLSLAIALVLVMVPIAHGQQGPLQKRPSQTTSLFAPLTSLRYGPNSTESVTLTEYADSYNTTNNHTLTVYIANAGYIPIPLVGNLSVPPISSSELKHSIVAVDSYFRFNRQLPQPIPRISSVTLNFTQILNPQEATDISQATLGNSTILKYSVADNGKIRYSEIPSKIIPGDYLIKASVYFPDYKSNVIYISRALVGGSGVGNQSSTLPSYSYPKTTHASRP